MVRQHRSAGIALRCCLVWGLPCFSAIAEAPAAYWKSEGEKLGDLGFEGLAGLGTGQADGGFLSVLEEKEGRDGHHAVVGGEVCLFVHVVFADNDFAFIFFGKFVDKGAYGLAGAAPGCPAVDYDRFALLLKIRLFLL